MPPTTPSRLSSDDRASKAIEPYSHLATAVNLGSPKALVVAVTGILGPSGPEATFVVSSDSNSSSSSGSDPDAPGILPHIRFEYNIESSSITSEQVTDIPDDLNNNKLSLKAHIQDLIRVLQLVSSGPTPELTGADFSRWLLSRCLRKLHHRTLTATREWDISPVKSMAAWKPSSADRIPSHRVQIPPSLTQVLREFSFPFDEAASSSEFNHATAPAWINCVASLVSQVDKLLVRRNAEGNVLPRTMKQVTKSSLEELHDVLQALRFLLDTKPLEDLFKTTSLVTDFQPKRSWGVRAERSLALQGSQLPSNLDNSGSTDTFDDEDGDEEEVAEMSFRGDENAGNHVFRYLRALVAWHDAGDSLIHTFKKFPQVPSVSIVELTDHSDAAKSSMAHTYDTIHDELKARLGKSDLTSAETDAAVKWLDERKTDAIAAKTSLRVHAEAGLMALAKHAAEPKTHDEIPSNFIKPVFASRPLPIGATKKCCYMCYRLRDLLLGGAGQNASEQLYLKGTHGHMFPWDVPDFGIPDDVLVQLVDELKEKMFLLAKEHGELIKDESRQSSPQYVASDVVKDYDTVTLKPPLGVHLPVIIGFSFS
ncbi:hypothetical protein LXA43DRAFT_1098824 [Ganoderma leucocontextum]|nr:hypothetical protein LXA43DRAFT_1098824 [Ganoderma leucocontextum]